MIPQDKGQMHSLCLSLDIPADQSHYFLEHTGGRQR